MLEKKNKITMSKSQSNPWTNNFLLIIMEWSKMHSELLWINRRQELLHFSYGNWLTTWSICLNELLYMLWDEIHIYVYKTLERTVMLPFSWTGCRVLENQSKFIQVICIRPELIDNNVWCDEEPRVCKLRIF